MPELAALEDPRIRAVNERHGDDHGVNLTKLRAVAKRRKTQHDLARELWASGDTAARLLALLVCRPNEFGRDELDDMLRAARVPKVHDWLVSYVVKKSPHAEELRVAWFADADPVVASAGWALTTERVVKRPEGLDLPGLLDDIEARMAQAPDRLQWGMNECLAQIGIHHPELRERAIGIGERLRVLEDYPTSPGCTSPYAPTWIAEMVRRQEGWLLLGRQPGSRPVCPSSRSRTGASAGTGTTGPYSPARASGSSPNEAAKSRQRCAGSSSGRCPCPVATARSQPCTTSSSSATTAMTAPGICTPPAMAMPSHASGFRQASTRSSSWAGSRVRQSGARWVASACGPPSGTVFSAAIRKARVSPTRWSSSPATGVVPHGVGSASWSSSTPAAIRRSSAAAGARSKVSMR